MRKSLNIRIFVLLMGALLACGSYAQNTAENTAAPETIDLTSLGTNWWSNFERPSDGAAANVDRFLNDIRIQTAGLQTSNQAIAQSILDAISDNMSAYFALSQEPELKTQTLPEPALS